MNSKPKPTKRPAAKKVAIKKPAVKKWESEFDEFDEFVEFDQFDDSEAKSCQDWGEIVARVGS